MNCILFLNAFRQKYGRIENKQLLFQYLREELQYLILQVIYTKIDYPVYFMGGTKLRLSYGINRFSEDIDFTLEKTDPNFPAEKFFSELKKEFSEKITGFQMHGKLNTKRNVVKMILLFAQLLYNLEISPLKSQTLKIKIEIDINPPKFATYETKTYRSLSGDYLIQTHDISTGFARKIGAVLHREYQKGRDYYDLQWYLQQKPGVKINLQYLNENCRQQNQKVFKNEKSLLIALEKKIKKLDIGLMRSDLKRFITMEKETFENWLKNYISETIALLQDYQKKYEN